MKLNKLLVFFIFSFIFLYFSFRGRRAANRTKLIYLITKFLSVSECQRAIFMFCPYLGVALEARHTGQGGAERRGVTWFRRLCRHLPRGLRRHRSRRHRRNRHRGGLVDHRHHRLRECRRHHRRGCSRLGCR